MSGATAIQVAVIVIYLAFWLLVFMALAGLVRWLWGGRR